MELIPQELLAQIPRLYRTRSETDPIVWVKFFSLFFSWRWYIIECETIDRLTIFYGWMLHSTEERGRFIRSDLASMRAYFGVSIQLDPHFTPCRLSDVQAMEWGLVSSVASVHECLGDIQEGDTVLNKVMLIGRLGKDPEIHYTPQGSPVATFSLATERRWRDAEGESKKETEWHTVVVWNKLGEACHQHLRKGSRVYTEGRLHTRKWEDDQQVTHYRTEVIAEDIIFLDSQRAGPSEHE